MDHGISYDLLLKTIHDRTQYKTDKDIGLAVVNTSPFKTSGTHWVIAVFLRVVEQVWIQLYDPQPNTRMSTPIAQEIRLQQQKFELDVQHIGCTALGFQDDSWSCGYHCLYGVVHATLLFFEAADFKELKTKDKCLYNNLHPHNDSVFKKMPPSFPKIISCILELESREMQVEESCYQVQLTRIQTFLHENVASVLLVSDQDSLKDITNGLRGCACND